MGEFAPIGKLLGDLALGAYIYLGVFSIIFIVTLVALIHHFSKKKNAPENGEEQKEKKISSARLGLVLLVIVLVLMGLPLVYLMIRG